MGTQGLNPVQVISEDFDVYQEYISGQGTIGDRSFASYGHADFNATQIIKSEKDGKKYLIDTKETKSFFPKFETPFDDPSGMKQKLFNVVKQAKRIHFDERVDFIEIEERIPDDTHLQE